MSGAARQPGVILGQPSTSPRNGPRPAGFRRLRPSRVRAADIEPLRLHWSIGHGTAPADTGPGTNRLTAHGEMQVVVDAAFGVQQPATTAQRQPGRTT